MNGIEWNRMESNGIEWNEWNRMESNGIEWNEWNRIKSVSSYIHTRERFLT